MYINMYIKEILEIQETKKLNKFQTVSKQTAFWINETLWAVLYDWLIGVSIYF